MKKEFRVIVDNKRNGEISILDELTVCRWEEAYNDGNGNIIINFHSNINLYFLYINIVYYYNIINDYC